MKHGAKKGVLRMRLVLPLALPTWNQILAMDLRQRMRIKKFIRDFVSDSIRDAGGSSIPMGSTLKPPWTAWCAAAYSQMTRRSGSSRSATAKSERRDRNKPLSRSR